MSFECIRGKRTTNPKCFQTFFLDSTCNPCHDSWNLFLSQWNSFVLRWFCWNAELPRHIRARLDQFWVWNWSAFFKTCHGLWSMTHGGKIIDSRSALSIKQPSWAQACGGGRVNAAHQVVHKVVVHEVLPQIVEAAFIYVLVVHFSPLLIWPYLLVPSRE